MKEEKLEKFIEALEKEKEVGEIDEITKAVLKKMASGEISPEEATEIFLAEKKKL